ncbi:PAS domain-containing protein [Desulfovibrio sp. JC010]|uniref:PAS domain-containing protein n=1 Tax=Desulfovibrio sp. JC010 TaxID=2593641 RepID=UPI001EF310B7|nr:PAS domain-containing protein [Desulfovibrio sp. JC010]
MNKKNLTAFKNLLKLKLDGLDRYEVVVTSDDNALNFALENKQELFSGIPVVFCGVNNQAKARSLNDNDEFTGVIESVSMQETIDSIIDLFPKTTVVYSIVDSTPGGKGDLKFLGSLESEFSDLEFDVLSLEKMSWAELGESLAALPDDSAVLLLSAYRDKFGFSKSFEDALQGILKRCKRPVFHLYEHGLGAGLVGGKVISHYEQGAIAARLALDIMNGKAVRDISVVEGVDANKFVFDRNALNHFKVRDSYLPVDCVVINDNDSMLGNHKIEIVVAFFVIFVLLIFSIALSTAYIKLRKTQELVRESRERFELAMAANKDGVWDWNIATDEVYYSPGYKAMLGYGDDEFPEHVDTWTDLIHVEDREHAYSQNKKCIDNELENFEVEFRMQNRDGSWLWILGRGNAVERDENGQALRMIGTHTDITELKSSLEEIRHLRNQLKSIIDSMPFVLVGLNGEGRVTRWNRKASEVAGIADEQAIGKQVEEVFPRLSPYMEQVGEVLQSREVWKDPRIAHKQNGNVSYDDIRIYPMLAGEQHGVVVQIEDVTERVRLEDMLVQNEKMLSVGGLAAGMAHEINNPLGAISQGAQNVRRRTLGNLKENYRVAESRNINIDDLHGYLEDRDIPRILDSITAAVTRAGNIVSNMLSFSRKNKDNFTDYDLSALLEKTIDLAGNEYDLSTKYDFKKIDIVREYAADLSKVFCEGSEIQQVFLNLLKNGSQSMIHKDYADERPRFILRTYSNDDYVSVEIEDNGKGIDKEIQKRIFEPFFTTKRVGDGTGLGLAISYFIITDLHKGKMEVYSSPGNWTKFVISLPVERSGSA